MVVPKADADQQPENGACEEDPLQTSEEVHRERALPEHSGVGAAPGAGQPRQRSLEADKDARDEPLPRANLRGRVNCWRGEVLSLPWGDADSEERVPTRPR